MAGYIGSKSSVTQVDGYNQAEADAEFVNDPNSVITVSGSNVGIGTSSPDQLLTVGNTSTQYTRLQFYAATNGASTIHFGDSTAGADPYQGYLNYAHDSDSMQFATSNSERMRIDSSGNLLVGKTSADNGATVGVELRGDNSKLYVTDSASSPLIANRLASDGNIAVFQKDGTTVGRIGVNSGNIFIYGSSGLRFTANSIVPVNSNGSNSDNDQDLGSAGVRFDDVYATNGTIQTSDRNEKQDIEVLSDAETAVAQACKGLLRKFRWIDSVAEKGDDARIHFGIIAQDLQDAFAAEGLDAGRYAMFISSTWWETQTEVPAVEAVAEVLDDDGNVVTEAVEAKDAYTRTDTYETQAEAPEGATERTRLGVRYPELLAFIIGAM